MEANTSFHVTMVLHEDVDKMKWTAKFSKDAPQSSLIDCVRSFG